MPKATAVKGEQLMGILALLSYVYSTGIIFSKLNWLVPRSHVNFDGAVMDESAVPAYIAYNGGSN